MTKKNLTELSFDGIKEDLINRLQSNERFRGYDYTGSNMSILLDVLAYNTYMNNFYSNMALSEMFLDSAQLRGSVVSHAKELNYLPRSVTSAKAKLNITLDVSGNPNFVVIPKYTPFTATINGNTYNFLTLETNTVYPDSNGNYTASDVVVTEGYINTELYTVTGVSTERFIINSENADTSTVEVKVYESSESNADSDTYLKKSDLFGVGSTDNVFYLYPYLDNKYEIGFGNNVFGTQPVTGNVVEIKYIISKGDAANGITTFGVSGQIAGYNATISTSEASNGGQDRESIESIKFYAPKSIQTQERAITNSDYSTLLMNTFGEIDAVSVFGGEEVDPPRYGKVYVAVKTSLGNKLSTQSKTKYKSYLYDRSPLAIEPIIIDPEYIYVELNTTVSYNQNVTNKTSSEISSLVLAGIQDYSETNLGDFNKNVRYSRLINTIDDVDDSIVSNNTELRMIIENVPLVNTSQTLDFSFKNRLSNDGELKSTTDITHYKPAIQSSSFTYNGSTGFLIDNGKGVLQIIYYTNDGFEYLNRNAGTVNYLTGRVILSDFLISAYVGNSLRVFARPYDKDIIGPKNRYIEIKDADINIDVTTIRE